MSIINSLKLAGVAGVAVGLDRLVSLAVEYQPIQEASMVAGDKLTELVGRVSWPFVTYPEVCAVVLGTPIVIGSAKGLYNSIRRR